MGEVANRLQAFSPMENPLEFACVKVADLGWTLKLDSGASLDSDQVLELTLNKIDLNYYLNQLVTNKLPAPVFRVCS